MSTPKSQNQNHAVRNAQAHLSGINALMTAVQSMQEVPGGDAFTDHQNDLVRQYGIDMTIIEQYVSDYEDLLIDDVIERLLDAVREYPLEVNVRRDWHSPYDDTDTAPAEYKILLSTGGPACQIRGTIDENGYPDSARLQYQDWGTPWTDLDISAEHADTLTRFAQEFIGLWI